MKKIILLFFLTLFAIKASADSSGTCGENLSWNFSGNTLTISGNGDMDDYWNIQRPWHSFEHVIFNIVVENGVTKIGACAFQSIMSLKSVEISNSVKEIGACAFRNCSSLTSISIPEGVITIWSDVFVECSDLESISLPSTLRHLYSFNIGGQKLSSISVDSGNPIFDSRNNCNAIIETGTNKLLLGCKNTIIPNSVTSIGESAFHGREMNITIPNSVTQIGKNAFFGCHSNIFLMHQTRNLHSDPGCYFSDDVYCFSCLQPWLVSTSYVNCHTYDIADVEVFPNAFIFKGLDLQNYDDEILSYELLGVDNEDGLSSCYFEPNWSHTLYYIMHLANSGDAMGQCKLQVPNLIMKPLEAKVVNSGEAVIAAETNLMDNSPKAGFEWRKVDAPDVVPSKSGEAVVYDGKIEGIIKGLDASSYYKFRPYYEAIDGTKSYGNWMGFDPSDFSYFEPTVHTFESVDMGEGSATFSGYVMQGSDEIISQGFEYWMSNASQTNISFAPSNDIMTVTSEGQVMTARVSGLYSGVTYGFRAFVQTSKGTVYGEEFSFTMPGVNEIEPIISEQQTSTGQTGIYTLSGVKLSDDMSKAGQLSPGVYIVNGKKKVVR